LYVVRPVVFRVIDMLVLATVVYFSYLFGFIFTYVFDVIR
jgi:hypothetical protein